MRQIWWADKKLFRAVDCKGQNAAHIAARGCQASAIIFLLEKIPELFRMRDSRGRPAAEIVVSNRVRPNAHSD